MSHETSTTTLPPQPDLDAFAAEMENNYHDATRNLEYQLTRAKFDRRNAHSQELTDRVNGAGEKLSHLKRIPGFNRTKAFDFLVQKGKKLAEAYVAKKANAAYENYVDVPSAEDQQIVEALAEKQKLWASLGGVALEAARAKVEDLKGFLGLESELDEAQAELEAAKQTLYTNYMLYIMNNNLAPDTTPSSQTDYDNGELHRIPRKIDLTDKLPDNFTLSEGIDEDKIEESYVNFEKLQNEAADLLESLLNAMDEEDAKNAAPSHESGRHWNKFTRPLGETALGSKLRESSGKVTDKVAAQYRIEKADLAKQYKADREVVKKTIAERFGGEKVASYLSDKKFVSRVGVRFGAWLGNTENGYKVAQKKLKKTAQKQLKNKR